MTLADKIIRHRKKLNMTQEELAEKMDVSRQAVSKWESAQAIPDIEKLLRLSALFGVSTDYLLREECESETQSSGANDTLDSHCRIITARDALDYTKLRAKAAKRIALGVFLCIVAAIPLIALAGIQESGILPWLTEAIAVSSGLVLLFLGIAAAVAAFVSTGLENEPWEPLDREPFVLECDAEQIARKAEAEFDRTYRCFNTVGICLCILSPIPLIVSAFYENELLHILLTCLLLLTVGIGVYLTVYATVRREATDRLLKKGDHTVLTGKKGKKHEAMETIYWAVVTAVYLAWSFITFDWHITWITWPIAAVLSSVIDGIIKLKE